MAFLDNQTVTVTATLTKKGRELLAKGGNMFNITQFALADDEIDYDLYNPAHPLGSAYYSTIIENMPLLEPVPDENQSMRYKLITLSKKTLRIPVVSVSTTDITLNAPGTTAKITPNTSNFPNGNSTLGYTAILSDSDAAIIRVVSGKEIAYSPSVPRTIGDAESPQSISVVGLEFEVIAKNQIAKDKTATVTIIGNETGGRIVVNLTIKKVTVATSGTSATLD